MKLKRTLMTITSFVVLIAVLKVCDFLADLYPPSNLEGRISTPVYAKDTGIQPRKYGDMMGDDYMPEIKEDFSYRNNL